MLLRGEIEAVEATFRTAEIYGFGNLISWLRWKWARNLIASGLDLKIAIEATNVDPYPVERDIRDADQFVYTGVQKPDGQKLVKNGTSVGESEKNKKAVGGDDS